MTPKGRRAVTIEFTTPVLSNRQDSFQSLQIIKPKSPLLESKFTDLNANQTSNSLTDIVSRISPQNYYIWTLAVAAKAVLSPIQSADIKTLKYSIVD